MSFGRRRIGQEDGLGHDEIAGVPPVRNNLSFPRAEVGL